MVSIAGLTDGVPEGIHAMIAYPIGDDDLDTERELIAGADVWVFFEQGDTTMPVVAFYRRHGKSRAVTDVRRIRQKNIELLARSRATIKATDLIEIAGDTVTINAVNMTINADNLTVNADIKHTGNQKTTGKITATTDVNGGGVSLKSHTHPGVKNGKSSTDKPN